MVQPPAYLAALGQTVESKGKKAPVMLCSVESFGLAHARLLSQNHEPNASFCRAAKVVSLAVRCIDRIAPKNDKVMICRSCCI